MIVLFLTACAPSPSDDELRAWPMPNAKFEIATGTMPGVDEPPPVAFNPDGSPDVFDRVGYLVAGNLIPEVSAGLFARIRDREILLVPETMRGNYATFSLARGSDLSGIPAELPQDAYYPVFAYNSARIAAIDTPRKALEAMLVVYHESRHVEQWKTATDPDEIASFGGVDYPHGVPPGVCRYTYLNELEAYHDMCMKTIAWDMPDFWQCVPVVDDAMFRHAVFLVMKDHQGVVNPECVSTWAKDAGHPKPSVYELQPSYHDAP